MMDHIRGRINGEKKPNRSHVAMLLESVEGLALHHTFARDELPLVRLGQPVRLPETRTSRSSSLPRALTNPLIFRPATVTIAAS